MIREFVVLSRLGSFQLKNKLKVSLIERPILTTGLILLGLLFFSGYTALAYVLIKFIYFQDVYGVLLATKLIQILLFLSVGISLVSSLTTAMTHLYLSRDLEFHFSLPVQFDAWLLHRFFQIYLQSNWMLLLFGSPLIWLFLHFSGVHFAVKLLGLLIFAILTTFPIFISTMMCMLLVKIFPARRVHQVFLVLTVVVVSSLVLIFRYLEPEKFIGPGGLEEFRGFVDLVNLERQSWNPGVWAYNAITALSQKEWGSVWLPVTQLFGLFATAAALLLFAARKLYRASWDRALQSLSGEGDLKTPDAKSSRLSLLLGHHRWSQEARELLLFFRDPSQWSQIFVLTALLILCLFSLTKIPMNPFGASRFQLALAATAMTAFICMSIASRFVFTSFSSDGQAIWLMKTTPEGWVKFMRSKLLIYGLPTLFFAMALMIFSGIIMNLTTYQLLVLALHCFWDSATLIFLALAFGMLFINPGIENPLKLIVSPGGVLLMSSGLFLTGIHVFLRTTQWSAGFNRLLMRVGWPDVQNGKALYYYLALILAEACLLFFLMRKGVNHLRKGDLG